MVPGMVLSQISLFLTLQQHNRSFGMEQLGNQHSTTDWGRGLEEWWVCPFKARMCPCPASSPRPLMFGSLKGLQLCSNKIMLFYNMVNSGKISPDTSRNNWHSFNVVLLALTVFSVFPSPVTSHESQMQRSAGYLAPTCCSKARQELQQAREIWLRVL